MPWALLLLIGVVMLAASRKTWGYSAGNPTEIELSSIGRGFMLRTDAAKAFLRMYAAAAKEGEILSVNSAFRSMTEQTDLYNRYLAGTGNLAAPPGFSNHQSGIAVDIHVDSNISNWLDRNAASFGFRRTVSSEPWHWEYRS